MRNRVLVLLIFLLCFVASCARGPGPVQTAPKARISPPVSPSQVVPSPSPSPSPIPPPPLQFPIEKAMHHTRELSVTIGVRLAGTPEEELAADYIKGAFGAEGWAVQEQQFIRADQDQSRNIIARLPDVDYSSGYVVIGGHYDTVPDAPGGNDNASGIGVVLALAAALQGRNVPVELIAFAAEEIDQETREHHEGSLHYVKVVPDIKAVHAMISVDMIGNGNRHQLVVDRNNPGGLAAELQKIAGDAEIPVERRSMGDVSDHTSFSRRGVWAVLLYSGMHPSYHSPSDTYEVVQQDSVDRAGRLVLEWLRVRHGL